MSTAMATAIPETSSHMGMDYRFQPNNPFRRFAGVGAVVAVHALLAYLLLSGEARKGLDSLKKPLQAVVIQEVIIPPPPPPPPPPPKEIRPPEPKMTKAPKLEAPPPPFVPPPEVVVPPSASPTIIAAPTPPVVAPVIAPPAAVVIEAPPGPALATPKPGRTDIAIACPTQVAPEMPRRAFQENTSGVVRARALIQDGVVKEVTILSGPRVFHAAVRAAMLQYKCTTDAGSDGVEATQEFTFKLE